MAYTETETFLRSPSSPPTAMERSDLPTLNHIVEALGRVHDQLQMIRGRLESSVDRIDGSQPQPPMPMLNDGNGPKCGSVREFAHIWLQGIETQIDGVALHLNRLENSIG